MRQSRRNAAPKSRKTLARNIIPRAPHRRVGGGPLFDGTQHIEWESPHERNAIFLLRLCSDVTKVETQPLTIWYDDKTNKRRQATPDFLVETTHSSAKHYLVEVKSWRELKRIKNPWRFAAIRDAAYREGYLYTLLTDTQITLRPRFSLAEYLLSYIHVATTTDERAQVRRHLEDGGPTTISELAERTRVSAPKILAMAWLHLIVLTPESAPSLESLVYLPGHPIKVLSYVDILDKTWSDAVVERLALGGGLTDQHQPCAAETSRRLNIFDDPNLGIV